LPGFARKDERRQRHHATTKQAPAADWLDHSLRTSLLHRDDHWNGEGPDGAPFEGAFVQAQNTKTRMAFIVLTDSQGRYRVEKVPAGEYQLTSRATGYRGDPRPGVILTADQDASFDFALQRPLSAGTNFRFTRRNNCSPRRPARIPSSHNVRLPWISNAHGFRAPRRDGWQDRVQYMRDAMHFSLSWRFDDKMAADVASFLNSSFGADATLPRSPPISPITRIRRANSRATR